MHVGRMTVRLSGRCQLSTVDGINAQSCHLVQRVDGYACAYAYALQFSDQSGASSLA